MKIMIGQVAIVICLAVVCSLIISVSFIPLAAARWAPKGDLSPGFVMRRLIPTYRRLLHWTLRHRFVTLAALILLATSSAFPIAMIEKSGEPQQQSRDVLLIYQVHDASSIEVLEGYVNRVEDWLEASRDELGIDDIYSWFSEDNNSCQTRSMMHSVGVVQGTKSLALARRGGGGSRARSNLPLAVVGSLSNSTTAEGKA